MLLISGVLIFSSATVQTNFIYLFSYKRTKQFRKAGTDLCGWRTHLCGWSSWRKCCYYCCSSVPPNIRGPPVPTSSLVQGFLQMIFPALDMDLSAPPYYGVLAWESTLYFHQMMKTPAPTEIAQIYRMPNDTGGQQVRVMKYICVFSHSHQFIQCI